VGRTRESQRKRKKKRVGDHEGAALTVVETRGRDGVRTRGKPRTKRNGRPAALAVVPAVTPAVIPVPVPVILAGKETVKRSQRSQRRK